MNDDGEVKRFVYEAWEVRVCLDSMVIEGQASGHADLWCDGEHKCRVALTGRFQDRESACDALERKAKAWVDDWKARDHSGETGFANLP
ncbi:hypothetical protein [Variovorax guangxiensis]|uniref:hypothetical protein n=1 Tax=Variovorax guangxiensis TaxID=1775474 RepID=UPI00285C0C45|nr:hypothetical protein [Variovorax guangxiensis]MDR6854789.1 hypothetical protein [Variovorax guangxiensis]